MAFRFKRRESVTRAARRICRERLDCVRRSLDHGDRVEAIHDARKEIKQIRAVLRLLRGEIGQGAFRRLNEPLRKVSEILTAPRDANVKLKTLKRLLHRAELKDFCQLKTIAQKNCRQEIRAFARGKSIGQINSKLKKVGRRIKDLNIRADGWEAIEPGLLHSYHCGRMAYERVLREPSAENFHKWRKRAKDLWCQFNLLYTVWPEKINALTGELEAFGDLLGDDHDLVMLKQFIAEAVARDKKLKDAAALNRVIGNCQKDLRSAALKIGAKIFAGLPSSFCAGFKNRWKIWRDHH